MNQSKKVWISWILLMVVVGLFVALAQPWPSENPQQVSGYQFFPGSPQPEPIYREVFFLAGTWGEISPLEQGEWVVIRAGSGKVYTPEGEVISLGKGNRCLVFSVAGPTTGTYTFLGFFNLVYSQNSADPIGRLWANDDYIDFAVGALLEQSRCVGGVDLLTFYK